MDARLGSSLCMFRTGPELRRSRCLPILSRCHRSSGMFHQILLGLRCKRLTPLQFYPGATYMLSIFYTRKEVATRIALLYCAQILATGFSGLIAAGVFAGLDGSRGMIAPRPIIIPDSLLTPVQQALPGGDGFSSCKNPNEQLTMRTA